MSIEYTTEQNDAIDAAIQEADEFARDPNSTDSAMEALMKRWESEEEDDESLSKSDDAPTDADQEGQANKDDGTDGDGAEDGKTDEEGEDTEGEESSDDADDQDGKDTGLSDDVKVTVKVNGEDKEFTLGSLKRLAGQEAALTQKSQEVASKRNQFMEGLRVQEAAMSEMLRRAQERWKPYADLDFALAAKQYDADTYKALRDEAKLAWNDLNFLQNELGAMSRVREAEETRSLHEAAVEAAKALSDPETGIRGFGPDLYNQMRSFALEQGLDREVLDRMVEPAAWKIVHAAMLYNKTIKAQSQAKPAKPKVTKVIKTTKTVPASGAADKETRIQRALARQFDDGVSSTDAAVAALLEKWSD